MAHRRVTPSPTVDVDAITDAIEVVMRRRHIPSIAIAIADERGVRHSAAFGTADIETGRPATPETSYLWFSMTKIATATAALRLADEGRLDLDAPIADYVDDPAGPGTTSNARVRNLLDHTAGYSNPLPLRWIRPADSPATPSSELVARILARHGAPKYPVGQQARYSNLGYLVLGAVIESASGEPFEDHLQRAVLDPVGMDHTGFAHHPDRVAATGYVRAPRGAGVALRAMLPKGTVGRRSGRHLSFQPFYVDGASYGGLVGDVSDVGRLLAMHLADGTIDGRRVLSPETARKMRTITAPGKPFDLAQGWFRDPRHDQRGAHVEHLGTGGGYWNAMRLYPDEGVGIAIMSNTTSSFDHHALMERARLATV